MRKIVFLVCIFLSSVLFIDGVSVLAFIDRSAKERTIKKYSQVRTEQPGEQQTAVKESPVNIIVMGVDEEGVRTDVIVLMNFSPGEGKLNMLSIARDTKIRINGRSEKINALTTIGGERLLIEKVEEMTGLPVNYYLTINFKGFRKVIDLLGGVELYVPFDMNYDDPEQNLHIHLNKGIQVLDGKKAEQFVRYRKGNRTGQGYTDGDIGRIRAQQDFMKALIEQKVKFKYISRAGEIFYTLKKYMKTNIEIGDINYYINSLRNIKYDEIKAYTIPGDSDYINDVWYFIHDGEKTRELIDNCFYK